jgi:Sigma-70 region 2
VDHPWDTLQQRLARLARRGADGEQRHPGRPVVATVGWTAWAVAGLLRPGNCPAVAPVTGPVEDPRDRRATRFERDTLPHLGRLYCLGLLMTGDSGDAQELVEETFTAACTSFHQPQASADLKAWLYRILINTYRGRWRPEPPTSGRRPGESGVGRCRAAAWLGVRAGADPGPAPAAQPRDQICPPPATRRRSDHGLPD